MITENNQIAVIILNYFGTETTVKCINSVQKILKPTIFLVDNSANHDERNRLLSLYQNQEAVHMFFPSDNLGFAAGVNLAIKDAVQKGFKWFLLLNNDAILLNGAGTHLKRAFYQWPRALIAPTIRWGERINKGNYYHKYLGLLVNDRLPKSSAWFYHFTGCALAFDKGFLDTVGLMNEKFFMYGEDVEFTFRALEKGLPVKLIEKELVYHEGSQSAGMASFFYEYHMTRMHYLLSFILLKNPLQKAISIFGKVVVLIIRAIIRSIRYKSSSPLTALILAPLALKIRPNSDYKAKKL
jgi:GT2 family glycosyltransferase